MSETKLYFTIDGEFLADFVRTRVIEGAWEHALKILVSDVKCSHDQAIKILKGEATFTGSSQIGNPKDKGLSWKNLSPYGRIAKNMKKQLDFMYGSIFKYKGKYWKPYAGVRGWDANDYAFSQEYKGPYQILGADSDKTTRQECLRSLYYANDHKKDLLIIIGNNPLEITDILCEETKMPPLWYDVPTKDPINHITKLIKSKKISLQIRGSTEDTFDDEDDKTSITEKSSQYSDEDVATLSANLTSEFLNALNSSTSITDIRNIERIYEDKFDSLRASAIPSEIWDQREAAHEHARATIEKMVGDRIRKQADELGGWIELSLRCEGFPNFDPPFIKVPKNPFILWALRNFRFEDYGKTAPKWPCIAGIGWKMPMDDPYHTDWMLGAGIPLNQTYDRNYDYKDPSKTISLGEAVSRAAFHMRSKIVVKWASVEFVILSRGEKVWISGEVCHPKPNSVCKNKAVIAIVPHAGPEYQLAMESVAKRGGAIICETGGKLAHLAVVGREQRCTVLMVPDALKKYRSGIYLNIDMKDLKITEGIL